MIAPYITEVLLLYQVFLLHTGNDHLTLQRSSYCVKCSSYIQVMIAPYITEVLLLYQVFLLHTGNDRTVYNRGPPILSIAPITYR